MRRTDGKIWLWGAFLLGLTLGALGMWVGMQKAHNVPAEKVTCRPTTPEHAYAQTEKPVLLLWGNSLLFDNDWESTGGAIVNCARQGQTAAAAAPRTAHLPGPEPAVILLAFGSVEAFHASNGAYTLDIKAFGTAMAGILKDLSRRWPKADVIVTSIPAFASIGRLQHTDVQALNSQIAALASQKGIRYLDLSEVLQKHPAPSYDGVHLSPGAYSFWEAEIKGMLVTHAH